MHSPRIPRLFDSERTPQVVTVLFAIWFALEVFSVPPLSSDSMYPGPPPFNVTVAVIATAGVGLRQRRPLLAVLLVTGANGALMATLDFEAQGPLAIVFALALTSLALGQLAASWAEVLIGLGAPMAGLLIPGIRWGWPGVVEFVPLVLYSAVPFSVGRLIRHRDRLVAMLRHDQEERSRLAIAAVRQRIAGELHDVVSHGLSLMIIQAGAARRTLARDPDASLRTLLQLEATGRSALDEMRRMLDVLAAPEGGLGAEPAPDLRAIPLLVERVRAAGQAVSLGIEDHVLTDDVPAGVAVVAYRVVQEGLTNVIKHARGATASVNVSRAPGFVQIEVRDEGPGGEPPKFQPGHGLWGMLERVRLYGGTLEVLTAPGGGFQLVARLPFLASP